MIKNCKHISKKHLSIKVSAWCFCILAFLPLPTVAQEQTSYPDISTIDPDLIIPEINLGVPRPGIRVQQTPPEFSGTDVQHILYLPQNWTPEKRYPVIVEYSGNGPYENNLSDISTGKVDGSKLGYGISGGQDFIWLCLPYISADGLQNQTQWWGNVDATVAYCICEVKRVCENWGGDPDSIILTGFSRGAIACGYIGLHNEEIAALWKAFIPYSHYDEIKQWNYPHSDRASATSRLKGINHRPSFIINENNGIEATKDFIQSTNVDAPFTYQPLGFRNHNDAWALRDIPARRALRTCLKQVLDSPPSPPTPQTPQK